MHLILLLNNSLQGMVNPSVTLRLSPELADQIDKLIESGEFEDRSEFIRYAIRKTLKTFETRTPPPS